MKYSLRTKISAAFFAMAVVLFLFISITANFFIQNMFTEYTKQRIEDEKKGILSSLPGKYESGSGTWDIKGIESIGTSAMERGLLLKVEDTSGKMLWDAMVYNNGYCSAMLSHMEMNMLAQNPNFGGGYSEKTFELTRGSQTIGMATIGFYGPYYYSDGDMEFINMLNKVLLGAGVLAFLLSLAIGWFLGQRLSAPIEKVIQHAKGISKGDFRRRITETSTTKEILELTDTINVLGETLERQEILRKRLSADIAHELRTPITTLVSHLDLMLEGIWEADEMRLRGIQEEALRLGSLVGELNRLEQVEEGNLLMERKILDLREIGDQVVRNLEGEYRKKGIQLIYSGEKTRIEGDRDKLTQVLLNLLSNGLHYTPEGGWVKLTIQENLGKAFIRVEDNGIGIPAEHLPLIFERFYRVDESRARNSGGLGIGLAITKTLVEAHQGVILVNSVLGKGTAFDLYFPLENN